jgi:hypothetical protein
MSLQGFLDSEGVTNIPAEFVQVMDNVVAPLLIASYGIPSSPAPIVPASTIPVAGVAGIIAITGAPSAVGISLLLSLFLSDVASQIYSKLTAGAAGLLLVPPIGVPGGPITPIALATVPIPDQNALKFGKALMKWAISFLPPVDLRLTVPFVVA